MGKEAMTIHMLFELSIGNRTRVNHYKLSKKTGWELKELATWFLFTNRSSQTKKKIQKAMTILSYLTQGVG